MLVRVSSLGVTMPTWVEGPHYSTRAKFVAQVVRKFGSFCTGTSFREVKCTLVPWEVHVGETEVTKWNEATGKCSANVIEKLNALGVKTVDDANAGMYTCIVALSRYNWGVRGPAASSKRGWVAEGRKLSGLDMLSLIEELPDENDVLQASMEEEIVKCLPHVTCTMCRKPIPGLRPSRIGRCPLHCINACKYREYKQRRARKHSGNTSLLQWLKGKQRPDA